MANSALSISTTLISSPTLKLPYFPRLNSQTLKPTISLSKTLKPLTSKPTNYRRFRSFCVNAENGEGNSKSSSSVIGDEIGSDIVSNSKSTMPDRFRYLTKDAPDPPLVWPWFVALGFLVYTWRAVLFELTNWKKAAFSVVGFIGYLMKLVLALVFHFIGDPITSLIRCTETAIYTAERFYSSIVRNAPVPELTTIIVLASTVLAIAEAAVPNSASIQSYLLTLSGLIGYAAVRNYISEPVFWTLLLALYAFSRLVKKRDDVTSALPVAAVLAAIGEPWVRFLAIVSYSALAIFYHAKRRSQRKDEVEVEMSVSSVPLPLLCVSLAIGVHLAAKWAGYRHLTWMVI